MLTVVPTLMLALALVLACMLSLALACMFALMLAGMLGVVTPMGFTLIPVLVPVSEIIIVSVVAILAGTILGPGISPEHGALAVGMTIPVMLLVALSSGRRSSK